jgi:phytoene dehydrogenase-like protein
MWGAIRARVRSPHLRWLLARYATYNGSDPRRAPATLNCIAHVELAMGGYGVEGGMYEVARALARAAERAGARIHTGARVERIRTSGGRVQAVETADGRHWPASAIVGNADAAHVLDDLLPRGTIRRAPAEPSMSGWVGIVRARRRTGAEARVAHTVLFPGAYMDEFADIFDRGVPPAEPTVYLCAQEACHGRTGWDSDEPLFAMANAPAEPVDAPRAPEAWARLRDTVMQRLRTAGLIAEHDALAWERTPGGLAAEFPGSRGSIYGAASNSPLAAFRRPPNRVPGVRGLYLASGSAHPGGGVPLCVLSGEAAARALLTDRGMEP